MSQPDGMITARVTINPPIDDAGVAQVGRYIFKSSRPRVWTATATPVLPRPISVTVGPGSPGEIVLPSTDQAGYSDGVGNSVIDFTYDVHIAVQGQRPRVISLALPCLGVEGVEVDFDSCVPVPSSTGTVVPIPAAWGTATALTDEARLAAENARDAAIVAAAEAEQWALLHEYFLVPDPANPGLYLIASGTPLTPDPAYPGLYLMGV